MKKIFFVFFVMFLTFGSLGNNGSTNIGKKFEQSNTQLEQRFYWKTDITPIELQSQENKKQIMCMAKNIFFEAATESTAGKLAVAQVVFNRVNSEHFPNSVCEVVYEGPHILLKMVRNSL